jgi:arylsulfatase A-like enzyme
MSHINIVKTAALVVLTCGLITGCERHQTTLLDQIEQAYMEFERGQFPNFVDEPALVESISLKGTAIWAFTPPFPARATFSVVVPENAFLEFSVAILSPKVVERARVEFFVDVKVEGRQTNLFRETLRAREANTWYQRRTNLSAWAGKRIELVFGTQPLFGQQNVLWADRIRTAWGNPILTTAPTLASKKMAEGTSQPSFIFLLVDTLRADYIGAYGFEGDISPSLDRLAMESILFENCFTNAPWTKPAVASLFTSLHPNTHGVTNHEGKLKGGLEVLPEQANTLAESFRDSGYDTAAFNANPWLAPRYGFEQGFETYEEHEDTKKLLEAAAKWIHSRGKEKPFFAYLHFMDVHAPYDAPHRDYKSLFDSPSLGRNRELEPSEYDIIPAHMRATPWATEQEPLELKPWRAMYAGCVRAFDRRISGFLEDLRNSLILDNAYLIFTSDHGEEFLEHGSWEHGYKLFEHQLHIPLLIRMPNALGAGRKVEDLVNLLDLMPTMLSLADIDLPDGLQGRDISKLLARHHAPTSAPVLSTAARNQPGLHAIRTQRHKLIVDFLSNETTLYDLVSDPNEQKDLSYSDKVLVGRLRSLLLHNLSEIGAQETLSPQLVPLSDEMRKRLESLGYVR